MAPVIKPPFVFLSRRRRNTIGADFFTDAGAIITWNARLGHWTIRRAGNIVGTARTVEQARIVARQTRETAQGD